MNQISYFTFFNQILYELNWTVDCNRYNDKIKCLKSINHIKFKTWLIYIAFGFIFRTSIA